MEKDKLWMYVENAYAHVPTLPGYWIPLDSFNNEFKKILTKHEEKEDIDGNYALQQFSSEVKTMNNYKTEDMENPISVIRFSPNKLKRIKQLRKLLVDNINKINANSEGWKDFAAIGQNNVKANLSDLDFDTLKEAFSIFFPFYKFKEGNPSLHEPPVMVRSTKWQNEEKNVSTIDSALTNNVPSIQARPKRKKYAKSKLMEFALFLPLRGGFDNAIEQLAKKALPEQWYYGNENKNKYPILRSYLTYTFERLLFEDQKNSSVSTWNKKIQVSQDGQFCIFNTGLVDDLYDPIYAWFRKNRKNADGWIFKQFVRSRDKENQVLTRIFGAQKPETAHYYNSPSELIYDIRQEISSCNWDHIIINRCERLPLAFLHDNVPAFDYDRPKDKHFYEELSIAIKNDMSSYRRIKSRIVDAISIALKRVKWNFKTAIPIYYPGQNNISLLLPLALANEKKIDCALVLESTPLNAYIAHTILTLQMAYKDARLINRPDSDWLVADKISESNVDDDYIE